MIFVLKGADFSANNIGKINISPQLSDVTKRTFAHMTRFDINSDEAFAFDVFYKTLSDAGVWSKINKLHLPVLGATKDEAFFDIIGGENYDIVGVSDDYMLFNEDGSVSVGTQTATANPTKIQYKLNTPVNYNNTTAIVFSVNGLINGEIDGVKSTIILLRDFSTNNHLGSLIMVSGSANAQYLQALIPRTGYPTANGDVYFLNGGFMAATHGANLPNGAAVKFYANNKTGMSTQLYDDVQATLPEPDGTSDTITLFSNKFTEGEMVGERLKVKMKNACYCLTKEAITDTEVWLINDALDNLMSAIGFEGKFVPRLSE